MEQTFEEDNAKKFEVKFFATLEEAKEWVNKQYKLLLASTSNS
jgi:hypothetical protein